jgi:hypothetical protein
MNVCGVGRHNVSRFASASSFLEAIARRQLAIPDRGLDLPVRVDSRGS